jgi:CheY-like chemotaxis protein
MSHELRTPLTAVVSFSELLEKTVLDEHQRDLVHTISTSADRLLSLINDILDFSRLEAEKLPLEMQPFDLRGCIEDVLDLVKLETRRKGLELAYHVAHGVPNYLIGDANRLSQVLTNLVGNAVKFSDEGEVTLSVRVRPPTAQLLEAKTPDKNHIELLFAIQDTGIGIPPDRIETLFRPFQQIDASTTRKYGGTGLGLAISKQIVQLMGGEIWAISNGVPGEGTEFYFTIRALTTDMPPPQYILAHQPLLQGKQVMLISGPENHRHIACDLLAHWGMQVHAFETCQQASSWLGAGKSFDLIMVIFRNPQVAQRILLEEIYKTRESETPPVIIITSSEDQPEIVWPVDINGWLDTPIKPSRLYDLLTQIYLQPTKQEPPPETKVPKAVNHQLTILIAEDDPTNRKAITMLLDHFGYQYEAVVNGIEAISALEERSFDIVLMDLQMPEMDGLSATRYIRASMPDERQPFIAALTADARKQAREEMIAAGVNEYLTKPVRSDALAQTLDRAQEFRNGGEHNAQLPTPKLPLGRVKFGVLDESVLNDFIYLMGDNAPDALAELISSFVQNTPKIVRTLRDAVERQNWKQAKWAAHTLKGNCELLGGAGLAQMCKQLESHLELGEVDDVMERIESIEVEFNAVKSALLEISAQK